MLFIISDGNPNGSTAHCPSSSWPDYTNSYTPYSPQTNYYDPHQDSAHGTPIHLPTVPQGSVLSPFLVYTMGIHRVTGDCALHQYANENQVYVLASPEMSTYPLIIFIVLPDPGSNEYISTSLTSPPPPAPMFNSAKASLDSMIAPRYPENNTYCPNNWGTNTAYPNNNYYNPPYNQQQYLNHPPAMMVYPTSLYSTVNQNEIHFHLHSTASEKNEQYLTDSVSLTPPQRVEVIQTATSEVPHAHVDPLRIEDSDRSQSQNDPSSVWRPY
ncbi:hypothetical protein NQ314_013641 [Rhamnusium bicolor]|uniref:Uncharacterized protein n=1 Tax=Rhamnusium bicolor TaxID=1586634 RepID=A0AAV8X666_9CUCU|nr:hypothetical protein NQ314_013641 [Rhamnusium bicolor]